MIHCHRSGHNVNESNVAYQNILTAQNEVAIANDIDFSSIA